MEYKSIQENFQSIPNAKSCKGWNCSIEGQYCPPGVPGSGGSGYTCCKKKWTKGRKNCTPKPKPQENSKIYSKFDGLVGDYKNKSMLGLVFMKHYKQLGEIFNTLVKQYDDRMRMIGTQNSYLNKQNSLLNLRESTIEEKNKTLELSYDHITTNKRKLMYESSEDRKKIIYIRILKAILLILSISLIILIAKQTKK